MFGSKIRSWMENHIVRPRKKSNKSKNSTNNLNTQQHNSNQNGIKNTGFAIYHGDCAKTTTTSNVQGTSTTTAITNSVSSPARRREVSPIQNHTTSRFGWQSPQHENPNSIKPDPFLCNNNNQQTTKNIKLQNTLSPPPAVHYNPSYQHHQYPITFQTDNQQQHNRRRNSSSSSSSQQVVVELNYIEPTVIINKSDDEKFLKLNDQPQHIRKQSNKIHKTLSPNINMFRSKKCSSPTKHDNKKLSNNKSIFSSMKTSKPVNDMNQNKQQNYKQQLLQQQQNCLTYNSNQIQSNLQTFQNVTNNNIKNNVHQDINYYPDDNNMKNFEDVRYGKILPTKHNTITDYTTIGTYDNLNANNVMQYNSDNLNNSNNNININNINNNNEKEIISNGRIQNYNNSNVMNKSIVRNGADPLSKIMSNNHRANGGVSSHMIRTTSGRLNGNNSVLASTNSNSFNQVNGNHTTNGHPLAHVINSLSSPESAYSTGYSTDGTSPGTTYTPPEYYINIRTGTHYFPKSVNTLAIEANRYKFGLNKIEEMSPQDPLPNNHRRTESYDFNQTKLSNFGIPEFYQNQEEKGQQPQHHQQQLLTQSPSLQRNSLNAIVPNFKGFESPSPRQRCRIRTNPWYSTLSEASSNGSTFLQKKIEIDASSSSSGIKSSSDAGGASDKNEKPEKTSDSETESSSTEIEVPQQHTNNNNNKNNRTYSPGTIRRRNRAALAASAASFAAAVEASCKSPYINSSSSENHNHQPALTTQHLSLHQDNNSDEDATLNEMMGKFDESYVYEKETDILSSDSDPTDCPSDLDTGQDAGDECDTDELLDIDFIDNGSIQEISVEKSKAYKNTGNCSYFNYEAAEQKRPVKVRRSRKHSEESNGRRKKKLLKTRKKSCELKEKNVTNYNMRESRSLGGTPVSLRRRNQSMDGNKKIAKISPLTNRSNSLTFTEIHAMRERSNIALADSEKALLKADLEADVKYKQLIHEAESILVSMKSIALRETPVASPRRVCNPPANKRVEMLRNCEADIKRELTKHQPKVLDSAAIDGPQPIDSISLINKRLEQLRSETNTAPSSPNFGRLSPKKTHITNFINQNVVVTPEVPRRNNMPQSDPRLSPRLQVPQRSVKSSKKSTSSPLSARRRFRSHSPRHPSIYSDSDTEDDLSRKSQKSFRSTTKSETEVNGNINIASPEKSSKVKQNKTIQNDISNHKAKFEGTDCINQNIIAGPENSKLISFRSIDIGVNRRPDANYYCPQSEPLKRKIYKGSSTFERIKKSLDLESEIPKQAILERISNLRRSRQALKSSSSGINLSTTTNVNQNRQDFQNNDDRQQLLYNTLEELKRNLEDQSVELNDLNENESQ